MEHIKPPIFGNILLGIAKTVNTIRNPKKNFPKIDYLLCAVRTHICKILYVCVCVCVCVIVTLYTYCSSICIYIVIYV